MPKNIDYNAFMDGLPKFVDISGFTVKPVSCPWCGTPGSVLAHLINGRIKYQVYCLGVSCLINPKTKPKYWTKRGAINAWNRRRDV